MASKDKNRYLNKFFSEWNHWKDFEDFLEF